jgi:MFS family permease
VWRDVRDGWQEFVSRPWLCGVIVIFAVLGLVMFGPYHVLSAAVLTQMHGASVYGFLVSAFGVGAVLGGVIGLRWMPARPLHAGALAMFAFAPQFAFIALNPPVPLIAAGMFVAGVGRSFWAVMWSTSVQTQVPPEVINRISAYEVTGSMIFIPFGRALAGPVAGAVGSTSLLLASGVFAVAGCVALLSVPAIRDLRAVRSGDREPAVASGRGSPPAMDPSGVTATNLPQGEG